MTSRQLSHYDSLNRQKDGLTDDWLVEILRKNGVDLKEAAQAFDIPEATLKSSNCFLPFHKHSALFEWAAEKLNDENLGIHIAQNIELTYLGILGYLELNSATLGDFCKFSERYLALFQRGASMTFTLKKGQCDCRYQVVATNIPSMRQDSEHVLALLIDFFRQQLGADWVPNKTFFRHSAPQDLSEHHAMFGKHSLFDHTHTGLTFDQALLDVPVSNSDPQLLQVLQNQANQLLAKIEEKLDIESHVRLLITARLGREVFTAKDAARQLNMTRRTLDRHLHKAGTSFQNLRDQVTEDIAKEALADTDTSITAISLKLGYSETSAFVRAFKRLTGVNPMDYRKQENPM